MKLKNHLPGRIMIRLTDVGFVSSFRALGIPLRQTEWRLCADDEDDESLCPRSTHLRRNDRDPIGDSFYYDQGDEF